MLDNVLVWILAGLAVGGLLAALDALDARRRVAESPAPPEDAPECLIPAWRLHLPDTHIDMCSQHCASFARSEPERRN